MTTGTVLMLLGMAMLGLVALAGVVLSVFAHLRGVRNAMTCLVGCALVTVAQLAFAVWPITHYLDIRDGHTDLMNPTLRMVSQGLWVWGLVVGVAMLIHASVPRRVRAADHE